MSTFAQNVQRIERTISIATGVTAIVSGMYRGGGAGIIKALGGAALLQRGVSGHCVVKGLLVDAQAELRCLRQRVAELEAALPPVSATRQLRKDQEEQLDHAVEETFPASDPISP